MSLRRFPWKAPRLSDNSFKLFVSEPNTTPVVPKDDPMPESNTQIDAGAPNNQNNGEGSNDQQQHHHHHHHRHHDTEGSEDISEKKAEATKSGPPTQGRLEVPKGEQIKGPWRLLRLLPRETRTIISEMLKVDPHRRAIMENVMQDTWVKNAPVCRQLEQGKVVRAGIHTHTLEPGSATPAPSAKN